MAIDQLAEYHVDHGVNAECVVTAVRRGRSPVGLFSRRADAVFVGVLRNRLLR